MMVEIDAIHSSSLCVEWLHSLCAGSVQPGLGNGGAKKTRPNTCSRLSAPVIPHRPQIPASVLATSRCAVCNPRLDVLRAIDFLALPAFRLRFFLRTLMS